jgi:hypothetical protein
MSNHSKFLIIGLPILSAMVIALFAAISLTTHDPHWLNRGGAVVVACSTIAILFQIKFEIDIEKKRHELDKVPEAKTDLTTISPIKNLAVRLEIKRLNRQVTRQRLQLAASVVMCAFFGELLHGFGDLLLKLFFTSYFAH